MSLSIASVCVCVCACLLMAAAKEGDKQKRDIMSSRMYNEPSSFYGRRSQGRRHIEPHHQHQDLQPHWMTPLGHMDRMSTMVSGDLIKRLNTDQSPESFLRNVNMPPNMSTGLSNRFGSADEVVITLGNGSSERKNLSECATCMPDHVVLPLHVANLTPNQMYYPTCTRAKRCAGCCTTALYSCQPTRTEIAKLNVMVTEFHLGGDMLDFQRMETIEMEQHTACKCMCIVKKEHCRPSQVYMESACRCECADKLQEVECLKEDALKIWNSELCMCECRESIECSTGFVFNPKTCGCTKVEKGKSRPKPTRRQFGRK